MPAIGAALVFFVWRSGVNYRIDHQTRVTWDTLPALPEPMRLFSAISFGGNLWVFGGYSAKKKQIFKTTYTLDMRISKWVPGQFSRSLNKDLNCVKMFRFARAETWTPDNREEY